MTEKELREQNADLDAQIEAAAEARATAKAAADERARIRDIETIEGQIADKRWFTMQSTAISRRRRSSWLWQR